MAGDHRIAALLEQILGARCTPEEACRDCPELLPAVRAELRQLRLLQDELAAIFPQRVDSGSDSDAVVRSAAMTLPDVPGYDQLELVGSGGMGVVYKARQIALNRVVAIKMLLARGYTGTRHLERFKREAAMVAALRHPNIVQVYDAGDHDGFPFFAMEYVEGGNLAQVVAGMPQPAGKAAETLATLARAVHVAHINGTVHRDLKPANILCTSDGTLKITDFGLARSFEDSERTLLTLEGTPLGTPSYMSPEQALGKTALGPPVDTYALGAILYEMLTGRPPFRGESSLETQRQVISVDPVPPTRLNPRTPRDLQTICLKCLEKAPEHRYATALALAQDLDRFLSGEPIAARPVSAPERVVRWLRRKPTAAALVGATVVAGFLGIALLLGSRHASQKRADVARAVQSDLREITELESTNDWEKIAAVLARAEGRMAEGGPSDLRPAVDRAATNLKLAQRLDFIRIHRTHLLGATPDKDAADRDYEEAFRSAGLIVKLDDEAGATALIRGSEITKALVSALDDWAVATQDERRRSWCLRVAQLAAPDPTGWRARFLDPDVWADGSALASMLRAAPIDELPPFLLVAAAERLQDLGDGDSAIEFLKITDLKHPGEFGVNVRLGQALIEKQKPDEAVGYFRTAYTLQPRPAVCNDLGYALKDAGRLDEAITYYQQAIRLDPTYALIHVNLGVALKAAGKIDEAIDSYRRALAADPTFAQAHNNLANALKDRGDAAGAMEHFQQAARLAPTLPGPHYNLALLLSDQERYDEAIAHYDEALRLAPGLSQAHYDLGAQLRKRQRWSGTLAQLQCAVAISPGDALSHTNLGTAIQGLGQHPDEALYHLREGVRLNPGGPHTLAALGMALLEQGKLSEAETFLRRALELLPESDAYRIEVERSLRECQKRLDAEGEKPGKPPGG